MARPKKYENEEERRAAKRLSSSAIREILENSGLTYQAFSDFLAERQIHIGDDLLRQYGCANKVIGSKRLIQIVGIAYSEGWAGDGCLEAKLFYDPSHLDVIRKLNLYIGNDKDSVRRKLLLKNKLCFYVSQLVNDGVLGDEVREMVEDCLRLSECEN